MGEQSRSNIGSEKRPKNVTEAAAKNCAGSAHWRCSSCEEYPARRNAKEKSVRTDGGAGSGGSGTDRSAGGDPFKYEHHKRSRSDRDIAAEGGREGLAVKATNDDHKSQIYDIINIILYKGTG